MLKKIYCLTSKIKKEEKEDHREAETKEKIDETQLILS
jgi:hypothetical protein